MQHATFTTLQGQTTQGNCPTCSKPLSGRGKCRSYVHVAIGPRHVGDIIRTPYGTEVVIEINETDPTWRGWTISVRDLDGPDVGRVRTHCTAWDGRRSKVVGHDAALVVA